jgi:hypothetical protein
MKVCWTAALLVVLAGCATASRVVRLDTGWFKYTDGRITLNTAFIPP